MKRNSFKAIAIAASLLLCTSAQAEKYLVVFKSKDALKTATNQLQSSAQLQMASFGGFGITQAEQVLSLPSVKVIETLDYIDTVIVDSDNEREMQALKKSGVAEAVDKEFFYPAPKPVRGQIFRAGRFDDVHPGGLGSKTPWGIKAVKAQEAWISSNFGDGARVVILDTGIDRDHPSIKSNFEDGRDFMGDNNAPYAYFDKQGHGTHVAGTIAGVMDADGFVGVAPKAKILMGRVCGDQGCSSIAITRGINWAVAKKADVLSMSLGGPIASPAEIAAFRRAEKAGLSLVAATGNDGKPKVSYPAAWATSIAVGAVDVNLQKAKFSNWGPEVTVVGPGVDVVSSVPVGSGRESVVKLIVAGKTVEVPSTSFVGSPEVMQPLANEVVLAGLGKDDDFKTANVVGKFALIQRGEIPFAMKVKNAIAAQAKGVVIFNNEPGLIQGGLTDDGSLVAVPVVMIEQTSGAVLVDALKKGQAPQVSLQTMATDYASFSGTSMATPHVAGVVALMKAAKKDLTPSEVKSILTNTADRLQPNNNNEMGAGLVNAEKAVKKAQTFITP